MGKRKQQLCKNSYCLNYLFTTVIPGKDDILMGYGLGHLTLFSFRCNCLHSLIASNNFSDISGKHHSKCDEKYDVQNNTKRIVTLDVIDDAQYITYRKQEVDNTFNTVPANILLFFYHVLCSLPRS